MRRRISNAPQHGAPDEAAPRSWLCRLGCHEASPEGAFHGGAYHSACRRCATPMIRRGASWNVAAGRKQAGLRRSE